MKLARQHPDDLSSYPPGSQPPYGMTDEQAIAAGLAHWVPNDDANADVRVPKQELTGMIAGVVEVNGEYVCGEVKISRREWEKAGINTTAALEGAVGHSVINWLLGVPPE